MGSTRIKGTKLSLMLGTPAVEYQADLTAYNVTSDDADSDVVTFEDASGGGAYQYKLTGTAVQSTAAESFWRYVWDNTGKSAAFTLAPHGNETPSVGEPHLVGTVVIGKKPDLGGEAAINGGGYTFDFEWNIDGVPVLMDGSEQA